LTELNDMLRPAADGAGTMIPATDKCLLPHGCASIDDAVKHLDAGVSAQDLFAFDRQVQELLRKQFRALVQVCMASSNVIKTLAPALLQEAEAFLRTRIQGTNVVDMYLASFPGEGEDRTIAIRTDLADAFNQAALTLSPETVQEISLIALPPAPE